MSIIVKNLIAIDALREEFIDKYVQVKQSELDAMDEMLNVLRNSDKPMTAAQIAGACTSGISSAEIASNLRAMKNHKSRYENLDTIFDRDVKPVNIPQKNGKEQITIKKGSTRKVTVVEVDENGEIIPNTKRTAWITEAKKYSIEGR